MLEYRSNTGPLGNLELDMSHSCHRSLVHVSVCLTPEWVPVVHQNHRRIKMFFEITCELLKSDRCGDSSTVTAPSLAVQSC